VLEHLRETITCKGTVLTIYECYMLQCFFTSLMTFVLLFNEPDYFLLVHSDETSSDDQCMAVCCIKLNYILVDQHYSFGGFGH